MFRAITILELIAVSLFTYAWLLNNLGSEWLEAFFYLTQHHHPKNGRNSWKGTLLAKLTIHISNRNAPATSRRTLVMMEGRAVSILGLS
jgi:hypothetical protein